MKPSRRKAWAQVARYLGNEPFNHGNILVPDQEFSALLRDLESLIVEARNAFRMLTGFEDTSLPAGMREMRIELKLIQRMEQAKSCPRAGNQVTQT